VTADVDSYASSANIFVEAATGNNAISIAPGAAARISVVVNDAHADLIRNAAVFVTHPA